MTNSNHDRPDVNEHVADEELGIVEEGTACEQGTAADEQDEIEELPLVGEMSLKEIEDDLEMLLSIHTGRTVVFVWFAAMAAAFVLLLINDASLLKAALVLGTSFIAVFPFYIVSQLLVIRLKTRPPDAWFRYRYVWTFSLLFNGSLGQQFVTVPQDRLKAMFERRSELHRLQGNGCYSPVDNASDRWWQGLGNFLFHILPIGLGKIVTAYYLLIFLLAVVLGLVGIVQVGLFIRDELLR